MWVTINKSTRILTVYIEDEVFKKFPIAVGSRIALTPSGKFTFVSRGVNPRWGGGGHSEPIAGGAPNNPLGKRWIGISKNGGSRYGVHGNASPNSIGTNASNGCIRMINNDVVVLYDYIKIGTPVWMGTTDELAVWGIEQKTGLVEIEYPDFMDYVSPRFKEAVLYVKNNGYSNLYDE
jgi:lipoprotein-anchoring transpeptidase ErfK/SrfK